MFNAKLGCSRHDRPPWKSSLNIRVKKTFNFLRFSCIYFYIFLNDKFAHSKKSVSSFSKINSSVFFIAMGEMK